MAGFKLSKWLHPDWLEPGVKPKCPVEIDWDDPITEGLWIVSMMDGAPAVNLVDGTLLTAVGAGSANQPSQRVFLDRGVRETSFNDDGDDSLEPNLGAPGTKGITLLTRARVNSQSGVQGFWATGSSEIVLYANNAGGGYTLNAFAGDVATGATTIPLDEVHTLGWALRPAAGGEAEVQLWLDAKIDLGFTNISEFDYDVVDTGLIGGQSGSTIDADDEYYFFWTRTLSDAEMREISLDPYRRILKPKEEVAIPAAEDAVGGNTITAAQTEAGDTQVALIQVPANITASQSEAGDSQAALIQVPANISANQVEAGDTQVASLVGVVTSVITASQNEAGDTQTALIQVPASISATQNEAGDSQSALIQVPANVSAAQAEAGDTQSASIVSVLTSAITANQTEAGDSQAAAIEVPANISASQSEAGDSQIAALSNVISITANQVEAGDSQAASILTVQTSFITADQAEAGDSQAAEISNVIQISAFQNEAGDSQSALIQVPRTITANQLEAGDTQTATILGLGINRNIAVSVRSTITDTISLKSEISGVMTLRSQIA